MTQRLHNSNPKAKMDAALALAETGNFADLHVIINGLVDDDAEVRSKAAYYCERIGFSAAIDLLSRMAVGDPVSDNRNQAIFALAAIGRPGVIPALIAALNDEDLERREDARTALYRVLGHEVLPLLADEEGGGERDTEELSRVEGWCQIQLVNFNPALVYAMGELASPEVFIRQLKTAVTELPDAYLDALHDWTGEDFGQAPLRKVIAKWETWWAQNSLIYQPGLRYFYGHLVP